jgi:cation diffusion facilitator family transporter
MSTDQSKPDRDQAAREKRRVALASLAAAVLLTVLKLVVGLMTNSLGILSEAAHSALDLVAAAMTLWAVRVSSQPADQTHTYGHGKFENLSALGETALLLATCVWIIYEGIGRLYFGGEVEVDANLWAFLVVVISIVVDFSRSRALSRAAQKHRSQALEADALHFSTDIWSSAVVLFGLAAVAAGRSLGVPWLVKADAIAALAVAGIVIWVSFRLGKKSIDDLLDSVPRQLREDVATAAAGVPDVEGVRQVRVRRSGPEVFADVTLAVNRTATFQRSHEIADQAEAAVRGVLPGADVVVHLEPVAAASEDLLTKVRMLAAQHGLGVHGVRIYDQDGKRSIELHLEVAESLRLDQAHQQVTRFEEELRSKVPGLSEIVSHIEPAGEATATIPTQHVGESAVREAIREFFTARGFSIEPHEVKVQRTGSELAISFHCPLAPDTAITDAHQLTERLESHLRAQLPDVGRVVIHVEPEDAE